MKKIFFLRLALIIFVALICILLFLNYGFNIKMSKTYEVLSNNLNNYRIEYEVDYGAGNIGKYTYASADKYYYEYASVTHGEVLNIQEIIEENGVKKTKITISKPSEEDEVHEYEEQLNKSENYEDVYDNWTAKKLSQISYKNFYRKGSYEAGGIRYEYETFETGDKLVPKVTFYFYNKKLVRIGYGENSFEENVIISEFKK